jgi:hypothetical protein
MPHQNHGGHSIYIALVWRHSLGRGLRLRLRLLVFGFGRGRGRGCGLRLRLRLLGFGFGLGFGRVVVFVFILLASSISPLSSACLVFFVFVLFWSSSLCFIFGRYVLRVFFVCVDYVFACLRPTDLPTSLQRFVVSFVLSSLCLPSFLIND